MPAPTEQVWLMKSEPEEFSFSDLRSKGREVWTGVRNYTARNYMMKDMKIGDKVLFYHSNAEPSGVAGLATVVSNAQPDPSQFDKKSDYYDPKSPREKPRWHCVEVGYLSDIPRFVSLSEIKANKKLKNMLLLNNSRLSVQPVRIEELREIMKMSDEGSPPPANFYPPR